MNPIIPYSKQLPISKMTVRGSIAEKVSASNINCITDHLLVTPITVLVFFFIKITPSKSLSALNASVKIIGINLTVLFFHNLKPVVRRQ